jgi:hypothetical protein
MHGETVKLISAQQAKPYNFKKTKLKLLKTKAAIWYNKICRDNQLQPAYINFKTKGNKQQDRKNNNQRHKTSNQSRNQIPLQEKTASQPAAIPLSTGMRTPL